MSWESEQRLKRNRGAKARRYVSYFLHQMRGAGVATPETDRGALEKAIALVRDASREQWESVSKEMKEKSPPSADTVTLIVEELQGYIARLTPTKTETAEELFAELLQQRREG